MSLLEQELGQTKPIDDPTVETILGVLKTSDLLRRELTDPLAEHDLTWQQYNVLSILREGGHKGLPVLDIADRMIEDSPNVTRLVDRLVAKGLVAKTRSAADRRVVYASLTDVGERLLDQLRGPMLSLRRDLCGGLSNSEMDLLSRLLEKTRSRIYRLGGD